MVNIEESWENLASIERAEVGGHLNWFRKTLAEKAIAGLAKNRMKGLYVSNRNEALSQVLELIPEGSTVGFGDSVTLYQIGAIQALRNGKHKFIDPWEKGISQSESFQRRRLAVLSDVFLSGTNALTLDGKLVNIDGLGNRVAALVFGPPRVIIVVGINKLVKDVDEALKRIKNVACPLNNRRHNYQLPCALTGVCNECKSERRVCRKTVIIEGDNKVFYPEVRTYVVIVGEELGF